MRSWYRREGGQAIIIVCLALVVLLGMAGLSIDVGRVYVAQRQLQQAVDAAGLVAGQTLPDASAAASAAVAYSATQGNSHSGMSPDDPMITFECSTFASTNGAPCQADSSGKLCYPLTTSGAQVQPAVNVPANTPTTVCNAVKITERATVPTTLLSLFSPSLSSVSASAIVAAHGGVPHPIDIMLILDNTGSVTNPAPSVVCPNIPSPSKLDCEKAGATTLLQNLWPCTPGNLCGADNAPVDKVGLMVFPALKNPAVSIPKEEDCTTNLTSNDVSFDDSTKVTGIKGKTTNLSPTISALTNTTGTGGPIVAASGAVVGAIVTGAGIPANTTVVSITGVGAGASLTMSKNATATASNVTLTFSNVSVNPIFNTNEGPAGPWSYQVVPFESSYADWDATTQKFKLSANDPLINALATKPCGLEAPSTQGSSFVDAILSAQDKFAQLNDGHTHVIIFVGDGEGNYGPIYYSSDSNIQNNQTIDNPPHIARKYPCQETVQQTQAIAASGVLIYAIGYWQNANDEKVQCTGLVPGSNRDTAGQTTFFHTNEAVSAANFPTENPTNASTTNPPKCVNPGNPLTGCWTIYNIASDPTKFYADPSSTDLTQIFKSVALDLTDSRIIPGG